MERIRVKYNGDIDFPRVEVCVEEDVTNEEIIVFCNDKSQKVSEVGVNVVSRNPVFTDPCKHPGRLHLRVDRV